MSETAHTPGRVSLMKPNINFLKKVRDGKVQLVFGYSTRRGGYYYFKGGKATAQKHADAGYIKMPGGASLGRPGTATMLPLGIVALETAERT